MKQSNFIQTWNVTGNNGAVVGLIQVEMNVLDTSISVYTNIDDLHTKRSNKIVGTIDGELYKALYAKTETDIIDRCTELKNEMNLLMIEKSSLPKDKPFFEKMHELGFKSDTKNRNLLCG